MFEDDAVMVFTSIQGFEMRQVCMKCYHVRYIPKSTITKETNCDVEK